MGSILFDFLTESLLFQERNLHDSYSGIAEADLLRALQEYRQFCISNQDELVAEAVRGDKCFTLFPGMHPVPLQVLKQSALYVERYVLTDPLFMLTRVGHSTEQELRSHFGGMRKEVDRQEVARAVLTLKALAPMVASDYVKYLPVSLLFEAPEQLPIYYSENRFKDVFRTDVLSFFHEQATVEPFRRDGAGWVSDPTASLSSSIMVGFGDDGHEMLHQLFEQEVKEVSDATRTITSILTLPDSPPTPDLYKAWVEQSINRTAISFLRQLSTELALSARLGASYVCFSDFRRNFLDRFSPATMDTPQHTAKAIINVDLPFIDEIDTESLMKLRIDDGENFQIFRRELEKQMWDLRHEQDLQRLRHKAEKIMHDLSSVQHGLLTQKLKQFQNNAVIQYATLGATVLVSQQYLPGLVAALGLGFKLRNDYDAALRSNPAYFLWKARRSSA
ncbi:MAG: hypothetical protein IT168_09930 [Bryobacterales bacterium]|nr:hypothetical protein [Bryobacterales bacterium]